MGSDPLFILIVLVCFAVVVILAMGLGSFAKGGKDASKRANKMMQYRIGAQALAVVLIVILVIVNGGFGGGD